MYLDSSYIERCVWQKVMFISLCWRLLTECQASENLDECNAIINIRMKQCFWILSLICHPVRCHSLGLRSKTNPRAYETASFICTSLPCTSPDEHTYLCNHYIREVLRILTSGSHSPVPLQLCCRVSVAPQTSPHARLPALKTPPGYKVMMLLYIMLCSTSHAQL